MAPNEAYLSILYEQIRTFLATLLSIQSRNTQLSLIWINVHLGLVFLFV